MSSRIFSARASHSASLAGRFASFVAARRTSPVEISIIP